MTRSRTLEKHVVAVRIVALWEGWKMEAGRSGGGWSGGWRDSCIAVDPNAATNAITDIIPDAVNRTELE